MRSKDRFRRGASSASALLALAIAGCANQVPAGPSQVNSTKNPQVALYTIQPPSPALVSVEFGPTTGYGQTTGEFATPAGGGPVAIEVAGMRANSTYHMRAVVRFPDGTDGTDQDHTFKTGSIDPAILPPRSVTIPPGASPQSGVELINPALSKIPNFLQAFATDLHGNVIWTYDYPDRDANSIIQPIKLLRNGHLGMLISWPSQFVFSPAQQSRLDLLREIDLVGTTIRQLTLDELNQRLKTAGYTFTLLDLHHDFLELPNGHWIVIGNTTKAFTDLPGYPGTTQVVGDALVDLDQNWNPVWVWNEFDHLDVNRHPMNFPDWTHTNAILYSPKDGNLLVSIRHQNWIVKVDYENGTGSGNVLWHLGNEGDFQLRNGTDPADWPYAQHGPAFQTDSTTGQFSLSIMDNGDDRAFATEVQCNVPGSPACFYTTVPVYDIDETAMTATLRFHQILPPAQYSFWGGGTTRLANGHIEYDLCTQPNNSAVIQEVTDDSSPKLVWQMNVANENVYRANRLPSLYPGVQW